MPVTKSAKKKLRQDIKRTLKNRDIKRLVKTAIKKAIKNPTDKTVRAAIKLSDKAAKKHMLHANKASRIKSRLTKLLGKKTQKLGTSKVKTKQSTPRKKAA